MSDEVMPSQLPTVDRHIPALDGFRGLACLLVICCHTELMEKFWPPERVVRLSMLFGWSGVDMFFVLSGFLITGILYDSKVGPNYFRNFYARRLLRIFPLYYAWLLVLIVIFPHLPLPEFRGAHPTGGGLQYWLYVANLNLYSIFPPYSPMDLSLGVSWTLSVEEQFYLVWPLVVFLFSRRTLIRVCVAVFFASWLIMIHERLAPSYVILRAFARLDGLSVGAFIALAVRDARLRDQCARFVRPVAIVAALAVLGTILAQRNVSSDGKPMAIFGITAIDLCYGAMLFAVLHAGPTRITTRFFSLQWLRTVGKYSYAMYLFHSPIRVIFIPRFQRWWHWNWFTDLPKQLVFTSFILAMTFALAWVSWNIYEKQILKLKSFFAYRRGDGVPAKIPVGIVTGENDPAYATVG